MSYRDSEQRKDDLVDWNHQSGQDDLVDWIHQNRPADLPAPNVERLQRRVIKHFAQHTRQTRPPQRQPALRWAFALALVFLFIVVSTGVASAAEASLPGEPLYGVKRLSEDIQLALLPNNQQAALHATLAERRLAELIALEAQGSVQEDIITDMARETELALAGFEDLDATKQTELLERLADLTERQQAVLDQVAANAPEAAQAALEHAREVSVQGHDRAEAALTQHNNAAIETADPEAAAPTEEVKPSRTPKPSKTPRPTKTQVVGPARTPPVQSPKATVAGPSQTEVRPTPRNDNGNNGDHGGENNGDHGQGSNDSGNGNGNGDDKDNGEDKNK